MTLFVDARRALAIWSGSGTIPAEVATWGRGMAGYTSARENDLIGQVISGAEVDVVARQAPARMRRRHK